MQLLHNAPLIARPLGTTPTGPITRTPQPPQKTPPTLKTATTPSYSERRPEPPRRLSVRLARALFQSAREVLGPVALETRDRMVKRLEERVSPEIMSRARGVVKQIGDHVPERILDLARSLDLTRPEEEEAEDHDVGGVADTVQALDDLVDAEPLLDTEAPPHLLYSPRDLIKYLKSPVTTWLDHYRLTAAPSEDEMPMDHATRPDLELWRQKGVEHEARFLKSLKDEIQGHNLSHGQGEQKVVAEISSHNEIREIIERNEQRYADTVQAMRAGADVIYQGYLRSKDGKFAGISDFLFKVQNAAGEKSAFGDYHYELWDTKIAKKVKVEYLVQLCCYADYLEQMQGMRPKRFGIINGNNERVEFQTRDYFSYYENLREMFLAFHEKGEFDLENLPFIPKKKDYGRYDPYVKRLIHERDLLAQVAGITNLQILNLNLAGIHTMTSLANLTYERSENGEIKFFQRMLDFPEPRQIKVRMADRTLIRFIEQARMQLKSNGPLSMIPHTISPDEIFALNAQGIRNVKDLAGTKVTQVNGVHRDRLHKFIEAARQLVRTQSLDKTLFEVIPTDPEFPSTGLAALPPAAKNDVVLDLEGYPVDGPFEYLFGVMFKDSKGENIFKGHWAYTPAEEQKAFETVMDWLYARWQRDPNMHIYHYASYEVTAFKRLAAKYGTRELELDQMLRAGLFVDVYKIVKQSIRIGASSYSIKAVEKIYMPPRDGDVQSALGSVVMFRNWLDAPDGGTVDESKKLKQIEDYNKVDDESLSLCLDWLRGLQTTHQISYFPQPVNTEKAQNEVSEYRQRMEAMRKGLLTLAGQSSPKNPEAARIYELLSQLLDFHWRESKSVFWAKYERAAMTDDQLVQDTGALGALTRMVESATLLHANTTRSFAVEAFDRSIEQLVSGIALNDTTDTTQGLPGQKVTLAWDKSVVPFRPNERSRSLVYTFKAADGDLKSLIVGSEYEFAAGTIVDKQDKKNTTYKGQVDAVDPETGVVHIRFGPKVLSAFGSQLPERVALYTEHRETLQYTYSFDPEQNTKLGVGDRCFLANDLSIRCEITAIDYINGRVSVKFGPKALLMMDGEPPEHINLIPDEYVSPQTIQDSIIRVLEGLLPQESGGGKTTRPLPKPMSNLLRRSRPRLNSSSRGPLIPQGMDETEGVYQAISHMNGATLAIQGPPGTGKSYQATESIVRMIAEAQQTGKKLRIGITALSHASIVNLMEMVARRAREKGVAIRSVKVGDGYNSIDPRELDKDIVFKDNTKAAMAVIDDVEIIGGTAWTFSHEGLAGKLDYLFVEEASQMSLANVLGMSPSTNNIVLLGDHRQLSQPNSGVHPGDSGLSVFNYYLNGATTIPEDKGILLKTTRRNHPKITEVFSRLVYDGQVVSHPDNEQQRVNLPEDAQKIRHVTKETGFVYVPVTHRENRHHSREEAEIIDEIVEELLEREYTDREGRTHRFEKKDIMVISPYVLQAQRLALKLGNRAQAGTIHKFQGRQAPVVIVSMAASDVNPSSPLMQFEFKKELLNVAFSRAQSLVIVVGSPQLERIRVRHPHQMNEMNLYLKALQEARTP